MENVAKKKRKRNTTVKNAKPKRRRRSNAHLKKKSVENALLYKLPNLESKTKTKMGTRVILFHNSVFTDCICGNKSLFFRKKK